MHPAFEKEIRALLGEEAPAFFAALNEPAALALRVNTLRPEAERFAQDFIGAPVPWFASGYYLRPDVRPGTFPAHDLGAYYLQEASAMVSAAVLSAQPGEKILDLCAAPGGKTGQIAAALRGEGLLISNEPIENRAKILAENLERLGVTNAVAVSAYPDKLAAKWPAFFDAVLTDAPCSGEGMFRRDPDARKEWQPNSPQGCAQRQADILDSAAVLVRPGGRLVYSTCTFNHYENEATIAAFLDRHPEFSPEEFSLSGIGESRGGMLRVWPHRVRGDGHFVAKLRKADGEVRKPKEKRGKNAPRPDTESAALIARLEKESCLLPDVLREGTPVRRGDYVHMLPKGAPDFDTIRVLKPGLCLLRAGRSHVQPMPALARACAPQDAPCAHLATPRARLSLTDEQLHDLQCGKKPEARDSRRQWTLLEWRNLPIGWQKI